MIGKRWLAMGVLAAGICVPAHVARAEDPTPQKDDAPATPEDAPKVTPKEAPKEAPKKDPFFGTHFAMYLETRGGPASFDTIKNPVSTGAQLSSENELKFQGSKSGQLTVGWTLPRGRGQYLLTYNGIADGDYELNATGSQLSYRTTDPAARPLQFPVPWWHVKVDNGALTTTKVPPVWNAATDDANLNTLPDFNEMRYPAPPEITLNEAVPNDLGNRIQTWDLAYRREFGGLRIHARWQAGLRYLDVEGAILTPTWLTGTSDPPEFGYSDGVVNKFILMQQSTSGYGPMGSGEVQFNFFRQRLQLYIEAEAAFLVTSLEADSNAFTFFARDTGGTNLPFPGAGRIQRSVSKTSWNTTFEAGLRVKLLEGFHATLDWNTTGYLDSFLVPTSISIPVNASEAPLGTTARFVSRDFVVTSIQLGLSFQF